MQTPAVRHVSSYTAAAVTVLVLFGATAAVPEVIPGRLVVKYRDALPACAHCLLANHTPFAAATGSDSLDRLHAQLAVRAARPLFFARHGLDSTGARAAYAARLERAVRQAPQRERRAPLAAPPPDLSNVYVLTLRDDIDPTAAAALYAADPAVEYAHPDHRAMLALTPNNPFFASSGTWGQPYPDLWGLHLIGAPDAWDTATGSGMVIAVVDTGVDRLHPDLASTTWVNAGEIPGNGIDDDGNGFVDDVYGWDFVENDADPLDEYGHGTHVAGIAAAAGNNGVGVVGMAFGARVMAVRGLDAFGNGFTSDLAAGIVYAALNGADVINNSWGGPGVEQVLVDAVNTATGVGAVVVAAAGNSASDVATFEPAGIPGVIAVAASDSDDQRATFSNYGDNVSVAAPGVDVLSTRWPGWDRPGVVANDYIRLSGTSMAAPHVSGLAAVLLSGLPGLSLDDVRWHLEVGAFQPGYPGYEGDLWNPFFGWGRIDAARIFDPIPATTRFRPHSITMHQFAGTVVPNAAAVSWTFTTHAAVDWTIAGPPWLVPSVTSGTGDASTTLTFDGSALAAGTSSVSAVTVAAPTTTDGGAQAPATAHAHRDTRVGSEIALYEDGPGGMLPAWGPELASNGTDAVVVWARPTATGYALFSAAVNAAGAVTGPTMIATEAETPILPPVALGQGPDWFAIDSDGTGFLVVWLKGDFLNFRSELRVLARRLDGLGMPLDATPIEIDRVPAAGVLRTLLYPSVAFDGQAYSVVWELRTVRSFFKSRYYFRRLWPDGSIDRRRRIMPRQPRGHHPILRLLYSPKLACLPGRCLFLWEQNEELRDGTIEGSLYAMPVGIVRPIRGETSQVLHNIFTLAHLSALSAGGGTFVASGSRFSFDQGVATWDALAARISSDGVPLDPEGILVQRDPATGGPRREVAGLGFDGNNLLLTFTTQNAPSLGVPPASRVFLARLATDGRRQDDEAEGLLVHPGGTAAKARLASIGSKVLVAWRDRRHGSPQADEGGFGSVFAQLLDP